MRRRHELARRAYFACNLGFACLGFASSRVFCWLLFGEQNGWDAAAVSALGIVSVMVSQAADDELDRFH